jgi:hypothetical protein
MILSKNELRSSSGRIRYRVRVRAGIITVSLRYRSCLAPVPLQCPTCIVVVPYVFLLSVSSGCSTSRVPLSHYSAVRLFAVRCSQSCARVRRALFSRCSRAREFAVRCSHALIRHGCCMQRYIGSCSYLDNFDSVLSVILMFYVFLWLLASDYCAVN